MKKIMANDIASSLIMIALGVVLMLWPGNVMSMVCSVIGWGLLIMGVAGIVMLLVRRKKEDSREALDIVSLLKDNPV